MRFYFVPQERLLLCDGPVIVQEACRTEVEKMLSLAEESGAFVPMTSETLHHVRGLVAERLRRLGHDDLARQVKMAVVD